jgi:transcriptional regulator with XRE-family HTH domain
MVQIPRLREWRETRALTQVELAERAGVSSRSVAGYEGGAGARLTTVRKLAVALGVKVEDLAEPTLGEWGLVATEEEFDRWLEAAGVDEVLKLNGELSLAAQDEVVPSDRHRYIVARIMKAVSRLQAIAGPFTLVETSRSRKERDAKAREDRQGREEIA